MKKILLASFMSVALILGLQSLALAKPKDGTEICKPDPQHIENCHDSDGDGVPDIIDKCHATKKGIKVDKYGCPATYLSKFKDFSKLSIVDAIDLNQDGIPDSQQSCFNPKIFSTVPKKHRNLRLNIVLIRNQDGTQGVSYPFVKDQVDTLNEKFSVLQFHFDVAQISKMNSSVLYDVTVSTADKIQALDDIVKPVFKDGMLNIVYVPWDLLSIVAGPTAVGINYFLLGDHNKSYILIADMSGKSTLTHEMGHHFGLQHTFKGAGQVGMTTEFVDESNCSSYGDQICDTPADPSYKSDLNPQGCDMLNCNEGTIECGKDPNGDPYQPDLYNIMSYWCSEAAQSHFSPDQNDIMNCVAQVKLGGLFFDTPIRSALKEPTVTVGCDTKSASSIKSAIAAIASDSYSQLKATIEVCEGVYKEAIKLHSFQTPYPISLTIQARQIGQSVDSVTIEGQDQNYIFASATTTSDAHITLKNLTLKNGTKCIYFHGHTNLNQTSTLELDSVNFDSCIANDNSPGGGIYTYGTHLIINGGSFTNNQATDGAAIYLEDSTLIWDGSTLDNNHAQGGSNTLVGVITLKNNLPDQSSFKGTNLSWTSNNGPYPVVIEADGQTAQGFSSLPGYNSGLKLICSTDSDLCVTSP